MNILLHRKHKSWWFLQQMRFLEWGTQKRISKYGKRRTMLEKSLKICMLATPISSLLSCASETFKFFVSSSEMPYGDQGLFMWRHTFDKLGGYPQFKLMEDYEMVYQCSLILDMQSHTYPEFYRYLESRKLVM